MQYWGHVPRHWFCTHKAKMGYDCLFLWVCKKIYSLYIVHSQKFAYPDAYPILYLPQSLLDLASTVFSIIPKFISHSSTLLELWPVLHGLQPWCQCSFQPDIALWHNVTTSSQTWYFEVLTVSLLEIKVHTWMMARIIKGNLGTHNGVPGDMALKSRNLKNHQADCNFCIPDIPSYRKWAL